MRKRFALPICTALFASTSLTLTACGEHNGNAGSLLVITPAASGHGDPAGGSQPLTDCNPISPPGEGSGSNLRFSGPCTFVVHETVQCVNRTDDYYAYVNRRLPDNAQLSALINVERYRGLGTYTKNSVVFLQVARQGTLYEWRQQAATLTVSNGGNMVTVGNTKAEPLAGNPARGTETVEGTLTCES